MPIRCVQAVTAFLQRSPDMQRCRRVMGGAIGAFEPDTAASPRGIFCLVSSTETTRPDLEWGKS